jgi:hypothetical protein
MISYDLMGKFMMDRGALKEIERMHEWVAGAAEPGGDGFRSSKN